MRNSSLFLRSALAVTAASVPSFCTAVGQAGAVSGISVSTTGSTVSVSTSSCHTKAGGSWGAASLLDSRQANFSQGRRFPLSGTAELQSAAWSNVSAGTYTVVVVCSDGRTAGTQPVIVSAGARPTTPHPTATASPARGVQGGLGGGVEDYGTLTLAGGGALVGAGVAATVWHLRRRTAKPYRL